MALDPELLDILVCPESRGALEVVQLPPKVAQALVEKYREHFRDEEPVADIGLLCRESKLVYPVISDIPMMLKEEALPAQVLDDAGADDSA
jgi:uncharacterized protein YbaR (Trm112 family)